MTPTRLLALALPLGLGLLLLADPRGLRVDAGTDRQAASATDDDPDAEEQNLLGQRTLEQNCLMCHSVELIQGQRLNPTQWTAEVDKMIGWGAPVPPEDRERLIQHLVRTYPPDRPAAAPERLSTEELLATEPPGAPAATTGNPRRGATLYATHCASCHGLDALGGDLGTCLASRPVLVSGSTYDTVVRQGLRRMPGFGEVLTAQDQADILAWLRQQ